jgi:hypothetical protein
MKNISPDEQIHNILMHMDFEKIQLIMRVLDWRYHNSDKQPTIDELNKTAWDRLDSALTLSRNGQVNQTYFSNSGGFKATCTKFLEKEQVVYVLDLAFIIEEAECNPYDFSEEEEF